MDITLYPGKLTGLVPIPPSKSMAHRLLICAAFADRPMELICQETNADIQATIACLQALGASILRTDAGFRITPVQEIPEKVHMDCRESGATLRFMLPIVGALGVDATIAVAGRLPQRPLSPLWEEMERMGCHLCWKSSNLLHCCGKLRPGAYCIDGSISSQFVSGLLLALPLIQGETSLQITGKLESRPYVDMTYQVLDLFAQNTPASTSVEGDWSSAAFWLAANALGSQIQPDGLCETSVQGDRMVTNWLPKLTRNCTISAADIPDLVPILAVVAACNQGATFTDIRRLRLKESDRVASVYAMVTALGGHAEATEDVLTIHPTGLIGGCVDAFGDHRIAMSAAIAATACTAPVTILGAECVEKSYPKFWEHYEILGGKYDQCLR